MARAREAFNKKDREKAMMKKRKDKEQKKEDRKANSGKGKEFQDMIAYVDVYGNIVSSPPDPAIKEEIKLEDIKISTTRKEKYNPDEPRTGTVAFFNDAKGFGFIIDLETQEKIFVHASSLSAPIKENDKVTFTTERGEKGLSAVNVSLSA
jgi:cold shock CspA family protein